MKDQDYKYYILPNLGTSNPDKELKSFYRIARIPNNYLFKPKNQIGHNSIKHLRKYSKTWKQLDSDNHKIANKICEEKFIFDFEDFVICPFDDKLNEQLYKAMFHSIKGEFDKELKGIHLLSKYNHEIEIIKESNPDTNGVWEAEIKVYYERRNKYYLKKTTFFPKHWTPTQFMFECYYALKEIQLKEGNKVYESKTISNIPVKAIFEGSNLKTIFPIYTKEKKTATNSGS